MVRIHSRSINRKNNMPTDKHTKSVRKTVTPHQELKEALEKAYPVLIGEVAGSLTERDALDVAIPTLQKVLQDLQARREELED